MSQHSSAKKKPAVVEDWIDLVAQSLLQAVREKDPYTYGHCRRVSRLSQLLAQAAGLNEVDQKVVELASLFHDLGKMGIPDSVLNKPGRLTPEEVALMRAHPTKSVEIVAPLASGIEIFKSTLSGIQSHHERVDGFGYPHGLKGDQIPLHSRIIVIADTFDAMTTTRPYRKGLADEVAYKELKLFAGRQFDGDLVKVFLKAHPTWGSHEEEITEEFIAAIKKKVA